MSVLIHSTLEPDGVLLATIDMPDKTMNVFSADLMDALDALMDRVDTDPAVRSVVLTSGKPSFLAGADLVMVRGYCDAARTESPDAMFQMCGRLGRQFVRLEASAKPWVAAVNGIALGGGLELALACRVRLVTDNPRTHIGVPEVRWGLLPGAGGTQRLPRMAGFEAAMDLLLSGRSLAPADAVRLGLFARAIPAARLLDEARDAARALQGQAYDANTKFPHLAQHDVPAWSAQAAQDITRRFGISDEDFQAYPAYSAIADSVLKGARIALAEATAVEMHQFLRLMFNPVAGRMVRTLFLERLRADRELAAPPTVRVDSLRVGQISATRSPWTQALAKLKLPQTVDNSLAVDTLEMVDALGGRHRMGLRTLDELPLAAPSSDLLAVLTPPGAYGRVLEIVGADGAAASAARALAERLLCLAWPTPGPVSILQRLRGQSLPEQARIAHDCATLPGAGDPVFLDVAACLAGVTPAWTGGPLTWRDSSSPT